VQTTSYIIALGSNRRHGRYGAPAQIIDAALSAIALPLIAVSRTIQSRPIGPSSRTYANAAAMIETDLSPLALLAHLKAVERAFGRRAGQIWAARVIDLDIILWSDGVWASSTLCIPHAEFRQRPFVLGPMVEIAPDWRDPISALSTKQLKARLDRKRALP
jgi:2-amino-4-hydroxy-6-hydroxymethyldihydropteridine diphosphokinase